MRLTRMTTRRLMIAVAVVGLLMGGIVGGVRLRRRREYLMGYYHHHHQMAVMWISKGIETLDPRCQRLIAYHGALARKYWYAARFPWLPVEPDPPPAP